MQSYQIKELEHLTGIKAHTIRIWEKRYGLITPHRTDTNRRYYDDNQIRKLLNVATLISNGIKISRIASYSEKEINELILDSTEEKQQEDKSTVYINDLIKTMLGFDEAEFERIFMLAVLHYGMYETMCRIIYPFLNKTGVLWSVKKAIPVQEHFANCIIRRKLIAAIDDLPACAANSKSFLLFLPPGEWHETGLLFANYLIRAAGHKTIYLGQNVPYENIDKIASRLSCDYMLTFYVTTKPAKEIGLQIKTLSKNNPGAKILVSGNPELFKDAKSIPKNVTYLFEVTDIFGIIK